jgi:hypothetical protein
MKMMMGEVMKRHDVGEEDDEVDEVVGLNQPRTPQLPLLLRSLLL